NNKTYDPTTGDGDTAGGSNATGSYQLIVQALPNDTDDTFVEATNLGTITATPDIVNDSISTDIDVDMYQVSLSAGETIDIDIDTSQNGPGGLGSYLRVFNDQGQQIAFNDDAAAPGESTVGFDAYLRFTTVSGGTFFISVSNNNNTQFNGTTGNGDTA